MTRSEILRIISIKWRPKFKISNRALLSAILMGAVVYIAMLYIQNVIALILIGVVAYPTILFLFRGFKKQTIIELIKLKKS